MKPHRRSKARATLFGVALMVSCSASAGGDAGPPVLPEAWTTFEAEYSLSNGSLRLGTTRISLQRHQDGWRYRSVTTADGLVALFVPGRAVESTLLERAGDRLRPTAYLHREPDDEERVTVDFDWADGTATARSEDGVQRFELQPDLRDGFSATLSLIHALAQGRERVSIPIIGDDGERERLQFKVTGRETQEVPFGRFKTVRIERERKDSSRETVTWLAPELDWVAVRVDQRDDGELEGRLELVELE
jgi:hypothetical protein